MPDFASLTLSQAESKLGSAGLKVGKITPTQVLGAASGTVVAQTPQRGQRVDAGTTIDLQVTE
jgi:beta-lactam-binding protein with PASTA domain